jgi:hypothetical protein
MFGSSSRHAVATAFACTVLWRVWRPKRSPQKCGAGFMAVAAFGCQPNRPYIRNKPTTNQIYMGVFSPLLFQKILDFGPSFCIMELNIIQNFDKKMVFFILNFGPRV